MASSSTKFTFSCPHCDKVLSTASRPAAGKRIRCPACGDAFVPELDDNDSAFQERPPLKARSSSASRSRRDDEDDDDGDLGRRKPEKKSGVNLIVVGLAGIGVLGLCLVCSGVGLTAFVWPGFALSKKPAEPKVAVVDPAKDKNDKPAGPGPDNKPLPKNLNYYPLDVGNATPTASK